MKRLCNRTISASEISEFMNHPWKGEDFYIHTPVRYKNLSDGNISFLNTGLCNRNISESICIVKELNPNDACCQLVSSNPEQDFYRIVNEFFMDESDFGIDATARIGKTSELGIGVSIAENSIIGESVKIGSNTYIGRNVYIGEGTVIGKHCVIKDNAIIGSQGYDFVVDEGTYYEKPCFGEIHIGDDVLIGHNTTIERPRFGNTQIGENVKIDDHVNIGAECVIEKRTLIAAGTVLCNNVCIGENSVLAPNVSIREGVQIAGDCVVGIGSVVVSDLKKSAVYAGNPASEL